MRAINTTVSLDTAAFHVSRRTFLRTAAIAGGGLLLRSTALGKGALAAGGEAEEVAQRLAAHRAGQHCDDHRFASGDRPRHFNNDAGADRRRAWGGLE